MKLINCSMIAAMIASLAASACSPSRPVKNVITGNQQCANCTAAQNRQIPKAIKPLGLYCRLGPHGSRFWEINPASLLDFEYRGTKKINYEIHTPYNWYGNSQVITSKGDTFTFDNIDTYTLEMTHKDASSKIIAIVPVAQLTSDLWLEGNLVSAKKILGTYYVFRTPEGSNYCQHSKAPQQTFCSGIHVEFFDVKDLASKLARPVLGKSVLDAANCPQAESSEGDGDEGER